MEMKTWKESIKTLADKYKYALAVLLIGLLLMLIPTPRQTAEEATEKVTAGTVKQSEDMETQLSEILRRIDGAGEVMVMLSEAEGERTLYQTDSTYSQSDTDTNSRTETILISDNDRNQTGLVHQKNPPVFRGAVVLAQGANQPTVKLAIVDAVSKVTGLGSDKISVLKMK